MSYMVYEVQCEDCKKKMTTAFGIVGTTQIAAPVEKCPRCRGKVSRIKASPKLDLTWVAVFKNGDMLHQFDDEEQTREHLFQEVLNRSKELRGFQLINQKTRVLYTVNLINGWLRIAPPIGSVPDAITQNPEPEVSGSEKYNYRLIYFRRVTRHITWAGKEMTDQGVKDIQYFLGFQYTNEKGENVKRLLQIQKNDEVYIG